MDKLAEHIHENLMDKDENLFDMSKVVATQPPLGPILNEKLAQHAQVSLYIARFSPIFSPTLAQILRVYVVQVNGAEQLPLFNF